MSALAPWQVDRVLHIIEGESLDGYVARVAAAHHMPRMADVTEVAGAAATVRPHATYCEESELDILAACLRIEPKRLRLHAPLWSTATESLNFFGTTLPKDFLQFTSRRFSPSALMQSPHHRGLWQFRMLPICTETWEFLQDRCPHPACGQLQAWRRTTGIDLCDACAEPLTRAKARPVPEGLRGNLENLIGLIHPDPERRAAVRKLLPGRLSRLGGGELLELAYLLAPIINPRAAKPHGLRILSMSAAEDVVVPAIAETWPFLRDWPHGLERFLIDRLNQNSRSMAAADWGTIHRLFYNRRRRPPSAAVAELITEFVDHCRASRNKGVTIIEAMELTGGRQPALFAMRRAGQLPSILALSGRRFQVLIDKRAIAKWVERNKPRERLTRAAEYLGVPTYTIRELVCDGLLDAAPPPPGRSGQLAVYQASLARLCVRLQAKLGEPTGEGVNLANLMKGFGGRPKPWSRVLAAILSGRLPASLAAGRESLVRRIVVADEEVLSLPMFGDRSDMDWAGVSITKGDLADMMNIRRENFATYSEFLLGPRHLVRDISMSEALRLARTYVNTAELGYRLGMHPTSARHLADIRGVKFAFGGLYHRGDADTRLFGFASPKTCGRVAASARKHTDRPGQAAIALPPIVNCEAQLRLSS